MKKNKKQEHERRLDLSKIRLVHVSVLSMKIESPDNLVVSDKNIAGFNFSMDIENGINLPEKLVRVVLKFKIDAVLKQKRKNASGNFDIELVYHVADLNKYSKVKGKKIIIDVMLDHNLLGISYSTSRGLIIAKTSGTFLENAFLPLIYPQDLELLLSSEKKRK